MHQPQSTVFSSVLIGSESLLVGCGEVLLDHGFPIAMVVTDNDEIAAWAQGRGLPVADLDTDLPEKLAEMRFEWLFSIANLRIIPDAVLAQAANGAINFHDGLLPAYAGVNAPVWALLNGEAQHGITWHLIETGIDAGDILEQRLFDVDAGETAYSLNSKCYAAGLDSFSQLIEGIQAGLPARRAQDSTQRSYFARDARPKADGLLDLRRPASDLAAQVNALDHARYWNPLCCAKIAFGGKIYLVSRASWVDGEATAPGVILDTDAETVTVSTGSGLLRLAGLTTSDGEKPDVAANFVAGQTLDLFVEAQLDEITKVKGSLVKGEPFWRTRLAEVDPLELPFIADATPAKIMSRALAMPADCSQDQSLAAVAHVAATSAGVTQADIAFLGAQTCELIQRAPGHVCKWLPLTVTPNQSAAEIAQALALFTRHPGYSPDLIARDPALTALRTPDLGIALDTDGIIPGTAITIALSGGQPATVHFDAARVAPEFVDLLCDRLEAAFAAIAATLRDLPNMSAPERQRLLSDWNDTDAPYDHSATIHALIAQQAQATPDATALAFENTGLSYRALDAQANQLAHVLQNMGLTRGAPVGLCLNRSAEMVIAALAILKAGGAYVPLDPSYPQDRLNHYLRDSAARIVVTHSGLANTLPQTGAQVLLIDQDHRITSAPETAPEMMSSAQDLAYLIYTSGSTGTPKGVMVSHRNVANFFAGMDQRIGGTPGESGGTWLAVTSMAFDISVLELFYTLARGYKVVLSGDENRALVSGDMVPVSDKKIDFSLYYWGNDDGAGPKKYELLLEGAKFADANGFNAVWTPERHFHAFGGPYPNPSVTGAAVAAVTKNISVRAGSCVAPLHHPARIAEEWAVIDNLTDGRAGLAIASGWQPDDFVLRPENTPPANKPAMFETIETLRKLWRGEPVAFPKADGTPHEVITQPRPVSKELPIWVTTAGNPETWREAGVIGANVLTHLLGQSIDEVAGKIRIYHDALRTAGHDPADHKVTLMLHTYVGTDRNTVREITREPMKDYLRSAAGLIKQYAWAFPAFKKPVGVNNAFDLDLGSLEGDELEAILDFAFQRYFEDAGLFGTPADCVKRVEVLKQIGVDEVACLIDYGIAPDVVLEGLKPLAQVLKTVNAGTVLAEDDYSIAAQIIRHGVTHLQCTPSMARMITMNDEARAALARLDHLLVGGEALPAALAQELRAATGARVLNMYGPTETTIWSTTDLVAGDITIGTPIANTQIYVLDAAGAPVPVGVAGELYIAGDGVTPGYWNRPEMTAERFVADPFAGGDARMYRTGDMVRWRLDGRLDYIGRGDTQLKIRGHRIELGEIEARLSALPSVRSAVVLAREHQPGDLRLAAYILGQTALDEGALRAALAAYLPDHMIPSQFIAVAEFPLTPNKKIDRKALAQIAPAPVAAVAISAVTQTGTEAQIAAVWRKILGVNEIRPSDSFFALGGHSLLAVQAHRELHGQFAEAVLSITDIFAAPTLRGLSDLIERKLGSKPAAPPQVQDSPDRSDAMNKRRAMRARRREQAE